jgi:dienelactone hydrolase
MSIQTQTLEYRDGTTALEAFVAFDDQRSGPRPVVLIGHQWGGRDDFVAGHARRLAEAGYLGFALDMYGTGVRGNSIEENSALMGPFMEDRMRVRSRVQAALNTARGLPQADATRVAIMGFCFGGLCALDLARSGADIRGAISFHGLLKPTGLTAQAIAAKVLVLHGADDPLAPIEDVVALREELNAAGCDWQVHLYGGAKHAFAVPGTDVPDIGARHQPDAERRSLASADAFLAEVLA